MMAMAAEAEGCAAAIFATAKHLFRFLTFDGIQLNLNQ
jgi:hypothetical protein